MAATRIAPWAKAPSTNYGYESTIAGDPQDTPDGALIVVTVQADPAATGITVTDSAGNAYSAPVKHAATNGLLDGYYVVCLSAKAATGNIVTVSCTNGAYLAAAQGFAYDGGGGTWSLDGAPVPIDTPYATPFSASVTTTSAGVILVGAAEYYAGTAAFQTAGVAILASTPGASAQHACVAADLITTAAQSGLAVGLSDDNGGYGGKIGGTLLAFALGAAPAGPSADYTGTEAADALTAAASARALAAALLADAPDAAHGAASAAATAGAAMPERPDTFAAASSTQALALLALAVIEARDAFGAVAAGAVLAGALLTEHDTLAAQALAVAQADLAAIDSADALAARLAALPQFADVDPRYLATLAARAFLAATAPRAFLAELPARDFRGVAQARAFLATLPARAFLAVLRMHTMTIDTTEEKDRDEPALLTFDFDQALPTGVTLTGAAIVGVAPLSGTDGELATWVATLQPQVGLADATLPTGATVKAGRYAQVEFPAGAGLRGSSYKFRCKGATADAAVSPICPVIVPVV